LGKDSLLFNKILLLIITFIWGKVLLLLSKVNSKGEKKMNTKTESQKFMEAYENLVLNSQKIMISDCKTVEVFLTGEPTEENALLSIVYVKKQEFWTKVRKEDPVKFDQALESFLEN
jgi:hypothetical protein